ncbi:hypothetical protein CASFOL_024471 [Castilleja foliolosa]|uniref:J domain-containing protein n=1 Tax=Castilleja foliolosa TaxID=1961234 RepID=A0ABD3CSC4_9LAMI
MDMHYAVLGLPGAAAAGLTEQDISKAYKLMALELHPDKRPDDPDAHAKFLQLKQSYEILKTAKGKGSRKKKPDDDQYNSNSNSNSDSKRRRMMSDLEKRERFAAVDPIMKAAAAAQEEEKIARQLKADISRIRATIKKRPTGTSSIPFDYKEVKKVFKPLAIPNPIISAASFNLFEYSVLSKLSSKNGSKL